MKRINVLLTVAATLFTIPDSVEAGAWTRQQGSLYSKLAFTFLSTSEAYDQDGNKSTTPDFSTWSLNLYGEYGVTDRLTAILRAPVLRSARVEGFESATDIGDISVEIKYGLITGNTPVAISIGPEFPTGNKDATGAGENGIEIAPIALPTGDGEYNTRVKASVSRSLHPIPAYVSLDVGYNFRTMGFTDEYLLMVQAGYRIGDVIWLQGNINAKGPVKTQDPQLASDARLGFGEGVQFVAYSLGVAYEMLPAVALSFDAYSAFGRITSIYSGLNLVFGISYAR